MVHLGWAQGINKTVRCFEKSDCSFNLSIAQRDAETCDPENMLEDLRSNRDQILDPFIRAGTNPGDIDNIFDGQK